MCLPQPSAFTAYHLAVASWWMSLWHCCQAAEVSLSCSHTQTSYTFARLTHLSSYVIHLNLHCRFSACNLKSYSKWSLLLKCLCIISPRCLAWLPSVWWRASSLRSTSLLFVSPRHAVDVNVCISVFVCVCSVPILACGGDDSRVYLYVQSNGQVSSDWWLLGEKSLISSASSFIWIPID